MKKELSVFLKTEIKKIHGGVEAIVRATGFSRSHISNVINGKVPVSHSTRGVIRVAKKIIKYNKKQEFLINKDLEAVKNKLTHLWK